jgi:nicotinamide mononucleotide (NMN) deamidase PncC
LIRELAAVSPTRNPIGLMCVALGLKGGETVIWERHYLGKDRERTLRGVMADALESLLSALEQPAAAKAHDTRTGLRIVK